jgi:hypothetical protein
MLLFVVGCKDKAKEPDKATPPEPAPGTSPAPGTAPAPPPADGRLALDPLGASVVAPDAVVAFLDSENAAEDGFMYQTPRARIVGGGLTGAVEITTGAQLGWVPTTLAADLADVARQGHENVAKAEKDGNWAAAYKLTDSCYLRSWSPAAKLWCEASAEGMVGIPCDKVQPAIDVCVSIAARGEREKPRLALIGKFQYVREEKLKEAIHAAGRAVATDDRAAFTALLVPGKIAVGKKKLDAAAFAAAATKAGSLSKLMGQDCARDENGAQNCLWNSESDGADGNFTMFAHTGYGEVPTLELERQSDGTWRVAGFGMIDVGEP